MKFYINGYPSIHIIDSHILLRLQNMRIDNIMVIYMKINLYNHKHIKSY